MPDKYFIKRTGVLNASGKDLTDFINRMSTNDLRKVPENEFRKTILTTDKGRIIDVISLMNIPGNNLLLTTFDHREKVKTYLDKYIIMDDVILAVSEERWFHIIISAENEVTLSEKLFNVKPEISKVYEPEKGVYIFMDDFKIKTINVICKEGSLDKYKDLIKDLHEQSCSEYEFMRIDAGIPEGVNEFNDNINPMECGLGKYISFVKGCYIGQEVIARLDSQGKLPKQMVKINSGSPLKKDAVIYSAVEKKNVGFISSTIGHEEKNISLGFIRSVNLDPEKEYFAENPSDSDNDIKEEIKINILKIN